MDIDFRSGIVERKIKLCFIGAGNVAAQHARHLKSLSGVEISGFYDTMGRNAFAYKSNLIKNPSQSIKQMFKNTDPDAVFICTPPFAHGEAEEACIEHKVPFFVEKPLSNSVENASKIMRQIRRVGIITSVGYMNRYQKGVQIAKRLARSYKISMVNGTWAVETPRRHPWLTQEKLSGGQILEQLTHLFDTVRDLCGEAESVYAYGANGFVRRSKIYDTYDAIGTLIKLKNKAVANISGSWSSNAVKDINLKLYGPEINIGFNNWNFDTVISSKRARNLNVPGSNDIFFVEDMAFLKAIRSGSTESIMCDYENGVETLKLSIAAKKSLETGVQVKV